MTKILKIEVKDIRFPTSNDLTGSDAIHTDPDYSAPYVIITTNESNLQKIYPISSGQFKGGAIVMISIVSASILSILIGNLLVRLVQINLTIM